MDENIYVFMLSCIKHGYFLHLVPTFSPHDIIAEKDPLAKQEYA